MIDLATLNLLPSTGTPAKVDFVRGGRALFDCGACLTRWVVVIPDYWPKNANRLLGRKWWAKHADAEKAAKYVRLYGGMTSLPRFLGRVSVRVVRLWGKRCRAHDTDNLYGAVKPLIDCLKPPRKGEANRRLNIIEGDSPVHMSLEVEQRKSPNHRTYCVLSVVGQLEVKP